MTIAPEQTPPRLRRDDWTVAPIVDHAEAVRLIVRWHYTRSAPNTSVHRHGLYRAGATIMAEPVGCAMWLPPTRTTAESVAGDEWRGCLSLTRFAIAPEIPPNAASFLLGAAMRAIDRRRWPWFVTYADTRHGHTGAIYRATNWIEIGPVPAGDVWVHTETGEQRGRKRGGKNLSVAEMEAAGFERADDAPKIKFVHHVG